MRTLCTVRRPPSRNPLSVRGALLVGGNGKGGGHVCQAKSMAMLCAFYSGWISNIDIKETAAMAG